MSAEKTYKPGDIITLSGIEFVILDTVESLSDVEPKYLAMTVKSQFRSPFDEGNSNNYAQSDLRNRVDEWLEETGIDTDHLVYRVVDLMTLDGYKGFGTVRALAAPLTLDERRKYAEIIPDPDEAEWLATGWGGPGKIGTNYVWNVDTDGSCSYSSADYTYGVRPALILDPVLLASVDDEKMEPDLSKVSDRDLLAELVRRADERGCVVEARE